MQFIPIVPYRYTTRIIRPESWALTLAHKYKDLEYLQAHNRMSIAGNKIILDNGAYELGRSVPFEELWELATSLTYPAQELVAPDVLKDGMQTLNLARTTLEFVLKQPITALPFKSLMFVPQGRDTAEWEACFFSLMRLFAEQTSLPFTLTIGIPKHAASFSYGRSQLLRIAIRFRRVAKHPYALHLLGIGEGRAELRALATAYRKHVRTIDSARPAVYAHHNIRIEPGMSHEYPGRKSDFFEAEFDVKQYNYMRYNVAYFTRWIEDE